MAPKISSYIPHVTSDSLSEGLGDFLRRRGALLALLAASSCSPGTMGSSVRPDDPSAAQAMGESCPAVEDHSNPLIIDWKPHQRQNLEIAMRQTNGGLVVVSYDCETLEVLPNCTVDSGYGFMPTSRVERTFQLNDMAELQANLPTFGEKIGVDIGVGVESSSSLDVALVTVGRIMTTRSAVSRDLLKGDCKRATHFVRGATIGAFAMQSGTKGQVRTATQLFGAGIAASSTSTKNVSEKSGSLEACQKATTKMKEAPSNCNAPVRLHLTAIGKEVSVTAPTPTPTMKAVQSDLTLETCPEGMTMSEGKCVKKKEETHQCKSDDVQDCTEQCKKGHAGSCNALGNVYANRSGNAEDGKKAVRLYRQACHGGEQEACTSLGRAYLAGENSPQDYREAARLFLKACDGDNTRGCTELGNMYKDGKGVPKNPSKAHKFYQKACDLEPKRFEFDPFSACVL